MMELDREDLDTHSFTVVAVDSSEFYPLTGSAMVSINILDKNDNTPEVLEYSLNDMIKIS